MKNLLKSLSLSMNFLLVFYRIAYLFSTGGIKYENNDLIMLNESHNFQSIALSKRKEHLLANSISWYQGHFQTFIFTFSIISINNSSHRFLQLMGVCILAVNLSMLISSGFHFSCPTTTMMMMTTIIFIFFFPFKYWECNTSFSPIVFCQVPILFYHLSSSPSGS